MTSQAHGHALPNGGALTPKCSGLNSGWLGAWSRDSLSVRGWIDGFVSSVDGQLAAELGSVVQWFSGSAVQRWHVLGDV
jgi:hypothetical protein